MTSNRIFLLSDDFTRWDSDIYSGRVCSFLFFLEIHFVVVSATAIVHSHRVQGSISIHGDDV